MFLLYTLPDFRANLFATLLDEQNISYSISSDTQASLIAGFGSSGLSRIYIQEKDKTKAEDLLVNFLADFVNG